MEIPFAITENVRHLFLIFSSFSLAFVLGVALAPDFITCLRRLKIGKKIRDIATDGKKASLFHALHAKKSGTPTMGGILIWGTTLLVVLLTRVFSYFGAFEHSLLNRKETYLPLFTMITLGLLGALDDYLNIKGIGKSKGLNVAPKMLWLLLFAAAGAWWFYVKLGYDQIHIPGMGDYFIGAWYIPLFMLVIVSTANAVNITDGLDGLAGGLSVIAFASFGAIAFMKGLFLLTAFCAVVTGATLAFLWFNIAPAQFYMGDTGSLALGATLGVIAMLTDSVLILPFIGFIFVIETLSVIIQLTSKKLFKKKVFHIAPIHHHFEHIGWPETQVTMRFWMIGAIVAGLGLILGLIGSGV